MRRAFLAIMAATAVAATVLPSGALPAAHAEPTKNLKPAAIKRGPDPRIPHVQGNTVVDGDRRIVVNAQVVRLLGKAGPASYVVQASAGSGANLRPLRVGVGQPAKVLLRGEKTWSAKLNTSGTRVAVTDSQTSQRTLLRLIDTRSGTSVRTARFTGLVREKLDYDGNRLLLTIKFPDRTVLWNTRTNTRRMVKAKFGYLADFKADRLAYYTGGTAHEGNGCSVLTRISAPSKPIWRSCRYRITAISPDASRLATDLTLDPGQGTSPVTVRNGSGRALHTFTAHHGFSGFTWETNRALLMETNGSRWTALTRCTGTRCNRASALRPVGS
ncbi:hypothetical protein [Nocardioides speluncae]|uniref:hypothetical protein n=1 Tax=Nocardioides speluncae TaxID=2670337 RepID=UPI0012B183D0|nr:hypothetical protein [Nocardioides speluncae]